MVNNSLSNSNKRLNELENRLFDLSVEENSKILEQSERDFEALNQMSIEQARDVIRTKLQQSIYFIHPLEIGGSFTFILELDSQDIKKQEV